MGPQPFIRAVLVVAGAFVLGMSALPSGGSTMNSNQPTRELEQAPRTESIDCGGYDADGNLVNPDAAKITEVPVTSTGRLRIPEICGGYSEDGTYVGDA